MTHTNGDGQVRGLARVVSLVLRFRAVVLILFLVMTGFLCLDLDGIELQEDPTESMMPPGHGFIPALRAIEAMDEPSESLIILVEVKEGDVYNTETVKKVERMTRVLMGVEEFIPKKILSLYTGMNHYDNTAEGLIGEPILGRISPQTREDFLDVERRVAVNPFGIGHVVSYDGTATMIMAGITDLDTKTELSYQRLADEERKSVSLEEHKKKGIDRFHDDLLGLVDRLEATEEDKNHRVYFTGDRLLAAQLTAMVRDQVPLAAAATLLAMLLALALYFKSLRGAMVPVLCFALSMLWGLGFLGASELALNPMAFLFPLLIGILSLLCSAMVVREYDRAVPKTQSKKEAILAAYGSAPIGASLLMAGLVNLVMLAAGVPMIRTFGWLGLFWLVGTFVVVALICPILLSLLPLPSPRQDEGTRGACDTLAEGLTGISLGRKTRGVAILLALILAAGGLCFGLLQVGNGMPGRSYVRSTHPWSEGFDLMGERFNGPYIFLVRVEAKEEGGLLNPEAINQMGDFSTFLNAKGLVRQSLAFDWVVKLARMALMDGNPKWWTVPASQKDMEGLSRLLSFAGARGVLVDESFSAATVACFFPERRADRIDAYVSVMRDYIEDHRSGLIDFSLGGGLLAKTKVINDGTRRAYRTTVALALVVVFLLGMVLTKSATTGGVIALSVGAGQALMLLIMTIVGWPVSLAAVPAAVVGVGFGALFGIYLVRSGARADRIAGAGGPVLFLSLLAFVCTVPWFFLGLKLQADMAILLGISVLLQAVATMFFLPALLRSLSPE